jgi:hypothetical protein
MDTKQKQYVVIEFLLVGARPGDEIANQLHKVYEKVPPPERGSFNGSVRFAAETPSFNLISHPGDPLHTRRMGIFEIFSEITHSRHCVRSPRCWGFLLKMFGYVCSEFAILWKFCTGLSTSSRTTWNLLASRCVRRCSLRCECRSTINSITL